MTRIDLPDTKQRVTITRSELEQDLKRGYCVLEYAPAGELVIKNPRSQSETRKPVSAIYTFRCMQCQFDVVDSKYPPNGSGGAFRKGIELMGKHLSEGKHPWPYPSYESPYGNVEDVTIEGVADYQKEIFK